MFPCNSVLVSLPSSSTATTISTTSSTRVPTSSVSTLLLNMNDHHRLQQQPMPWAPISLIHLPGSGFVLDPRLLFPTTVTPAVPSNRTGLMQLNCYTPSANNNNNNNNNNGANFLIPPSTSVSFARTTMFPSNNNNGVGSFGPVTVATRNTAAEEQVGDSGPSIVVGQSDDNAVGPSSALHHQQEQQQHQQGQWYMDRPSKRPRQPSPPDELESDDDSTSSGEEEEENIQNSQKSDRLFGEKRLIIKFESLGTCGKRAPRLGQQGNAIPSGLVGFFTAYNEQWRVEIRYDADENRQAAKSGITCVTWSITNLCSMHTISRKESIDEANTRERNGRTITNQVCKQALQKRAMELEAILAETKSQDRRSSILADIKALRPKRFTQGPLFFGLLHRCVQVHVQAQVKTRSVVV